MEKYPPLDINGNDLQIGDLVRVILAPLSIKNMQNETKEAFSKAVGNTFQIESFDDIGCIELEMFPKVSMDTIWLEPFCAERFRRYKRLSKSFQRKLEQNSAPQPPRYEIKFDIRFKEGVDVQEFGQHLISLGSGGGFACWPEKRRIQGSVCANKSEPDAIDILENVRRIIMESEHINFRELSEIAESREI